MEEPIPREFAAIYAEGEVLRQRIIAHFENWPRKDGHPISLFQKQPSDHRANVQEIQDAAHRWFNRIFVDVLPYTSYDRRYVNLLLRRTTSAIRGAVYHEETLERAFDGATYTARDVESPWPLEHVREEAEDALSLTLRLVRTAAPISSRPPASAGEVSTSHVRNTAFILMWMDPARPELVDVHEAVKEVFAEFGVRAYRADDIQHQDKITDLVLEQIRNAEFLFADLTGERPNVYYEVGYAHALGKRPILYRRSKTALHFDLAVHNVPEYDNVTQLRKLLRARLVAITGKSFDATTFAPDAGA